MSMGCYPIKRYAIIISALIAAAGPASAQLNEFDLPAGSLLPESAVQSLAPNQEECAITLDADTPATGSLLQTQPLVTAFGTISFVGEVRTSTADPDMPPAGASGDGLDINNTPVSDATLSFDFDVTSITFIYGGNAGVADIEARDIDALTVASFFQQSTGGGQPVGPVTLAGDGIRSLFWKDPGFSYLVLDNLCIEAALIEIDIKPGSDPNAINPMNVGLVPVAILGSDTVNVLDADPDTLAFGPDGATLAHPNGPHFDDVNDDGFTDLLAHFVVKETGIAFGDEEACLTGEIDGMPFEACDDIKTVPACGIGFELAFLLPPLLWLRRLRRRRIH